jgi:hypothetical protein
MVMPRPNGYPRSLGDRRARHFNARFSTSEIAPLTDYIRFFNHDDTSRTSLEDLGEGVVIYNAVDGNLNILQSGGTWILPDGTGT